MFLHNFKYALKIIFRNKSLIFWTFAFPIILGTFFKLAFNNIEKGETLSTIDIAIIDNQEFNDNQFYKEAFNQLSTGENKMFNTKYTTLENAKKLLSDEEITGYLVLSNDVMNITVNSSGINETIIKTVVDEINTNKNMYETLINKEIENEFKSGNTNIDYKDIYNKVTVKIISDVKLNDISNSNLSYTMIEYYTLIALTILYGGTISLYMVNKTLPNLSEVGKRVNTSSLKRSTILFSNLLASYVVQLIGLCILFIYCVFVIKADFGDNLPLIILLSLIGVFAGLSMGVFIGVNVKGSEGAKSGILIGITMLFNTLAGMTGVTLKYVIDKNIPIINKINPANMITDGFYSLYYLNGMNRYFFNIMSLIIFSIVLLRFSLKKLRRQQYDSI